MRNFFVFMGVLIFGLCGYAFSQPGPTGDPMAIMNMLPEMTNSAVGNALNAETAAVEESVNETQRIIVGNRICPVSGQEIKPGSQAEYVYKGKVYNFCCPMCIDTFQQDPEKYLKLLEENEKAAAAKAKDTPAKKSAAEKK